MRVQDIEREQGRVDDDLVEAEIVGVVHIPTAHTVSRPGEQAEMCCAVMCATGLMFYLAYVLYAFKLF
jgi:hypothetical protein